MRIPTLASIAALSLALGGAAVAADQNRISPNTDGTGLQGSTFHNRGAGEAAGGHSAAGDTRPDISSQSSPVIEQQAVTPLPGASSSTTTTSRGTVVSSQQTTVSGDLQEDRAAVRQVQNKLKAEGYDVGEVDGVWGPRTQQALSAYQRDKGLEPSAGLSRDVLLSLDIEPQGPEQTAQQPALRDNASEPIGSDQPGPGGDTQQ